MIHILQIITLSGGIIELMFAGAQLAVPSRSSYNLLLAGMCLFLGGYLIPCGLPAFHDGPIALSSFRISFTICMLSGHLVAPFAYLCYKTIVDESFEATGRLVLFFLPSFFAGFLLFIYGTSLPEMRGTAIELEDYLYSNHWPYLILPVTSIASSILFAFEIMMTIRRQRKKNGMRNQTIRMMNIFLGIFIPIMVIWGLVFFMDSPARGKAFVHALIALYFVGIYIVSERYSLLFHPAVRSTKANRSGLSAFEMEQGLRNLAKAMEENKRYLEPELTVKDLASSVGVTPHQLSELINRSMGCNFAQYVNRCRIEESKKRLLAEDPDSVLTIALESGFNSSSAFYRTFKQHTGSTPKDYVKERRGR